jgi:hypothetical protein
MPNNGLKRMFFALNYKTSHFASGNWRGKGVANPGAGSGPRKRTFSALAFFSRTDASNTFAGPDPLAGVTPPPGNPARLFRIYGRIKTTAIIQGSAIPSAATSTQLVLLSQGFQ